MRRIIIDTDTGSDDAVALIMGLKSPDLQVEAITTVCGNVGLEQATQNALMTREIVRAQTPPVYKGAPRPLFRRLVTAAEVHGRDGMGDCGLIHPAGRAEPRAAVEALVDLVRSAPGEIELLTIGPLTNIAAALLTAPEAMAGIKRIYVMGSGGFGPGNITPVAEFNVYVDAEAFRILLNAGLPLTLVGFDQCHEGTALNRADMDRLAASSRPEARFALGCNRTRLEYYRRRGEEPLLHLPDAVAMGVLLWEDILLEAEECYAHVCLDQGETYGQVILYKGGREDQGPNALVCRTLDGALYKERLLELLCC